MGKTVLLASVGLLMVIGSAAHAATISITKTATATNGILDDLTFEFSGLTPSDGTGGILTIATGDAGPFPGLDITDPGEFFTLLADGNSLGSYTCAIGTAATTIPGATTPVSLDDCIFSLSLGLTGAQLDTLLADGSTVVEMLFSDFVDDFGDGDTVTATLSYTEADTPEVIPLPATATLLLGGLGLMGALRRRRATRD